MRCPPKVHKDPLPHVSPRVVFLEFKMMGVDSIFLVGRRIHPELWRGAIAFLQLPSALDLLTLVCLAVSTPILVTNYPSQRACQHLHWTTYSLQRQSQRTWELQRVVTKIHFTYHFDVRTRHFIMYFRLYMIFSVRQSEDFQRDGNMGWRSLYFRTLRSEIQA